MEQPTVGRIVHYVLSDGRSAGEHRPGIIVRVWEDGHGVQLQVFTDGSNDGPQFASGLYWATSVEYDDGGRPGTWHWPERQ